MTIRSKLFNMLAVRKTDPLRRGLRLFFSLAIIFVFNFS